MPEQPTRQADEQAGLRGGRVHVNGTVLVGKPATIVPATDEQSAAFTKEAIEGALDKVSRPTSRGKYAHVPYGSEDLIRDKRAEVELEDRPS